MPIFLTAALILVIVYFFVIKRNATGQSQSALSEDEAALLQRCFNDAAQMEQRRSPSETRAQAVRSAIQSLKH